MKWHVLFDCAIPHGFISINNSVDECTLDFQQRQQGLLCSAYRSSIQILVVLHALSEFCSVGDNWHENNRLVGVLYFKMTRWPRLNFFPSNEEDLLYSLLFLLMDNLATLPPFFCLLGSHF
jgi:hypothetical protein